MNPPQANTPAGEGATREEEVSFEEEVDRDSLGGHGPLPAYHQSAWLLGLPLLCALVIGWNVRWRRGR